MEGSKAYPQPAATVLDAINDIVELQNGRLTFSDTPHGMINFVIRMYSNEWELRFEVTETGENRCGVKIGIEEETGGGKDQIIREFALLDSMILSKAEVDFVPA